MRESKVPFINPEFEENDPFMGRERERESNLTDACAEGHWVAIQSKCLLKFFPVPNLGRNNLKNRSFLLEAIIIL